MYLRPKLDEEFISKYTKVSEQKKEQKKKQKTIIKFDFSYIFRI